MKLLLDMNGVRPSPAATTSARTRVLENSRAPGLSPFAAPDDGRTPGDFARLVRSALDRLTTANGVRPSPAAATSARPNAHELTRRPSHCHLAAPEDWRTPALPRDAQPLVRISKSRAAPRPFRRRRHKLCLHRIVLDVSPRSRLVRAISHVSIPIPVLPELPFASQNLIRLLGRAAFPRIN